ncbi:hypothetical protein EYR38_008735 [Pleurotus pulmonarius]|nr:hypothetical protein EYR38_008735 [Pleurotus pulmonarius]
MFSRRSPPTEFSSPPSSPSLFAADSSPPSSPGLDTSDLQLDDSPLIHPFAASSKPLPRYEKRVRSIASDVLAAGPAAKKPRRGSFTNDIDDSFLESSFPSIEFGEAMDPEAADWDRVITDVIDHGHGTVRLEDRELTYIPGNAMRDLQGFRALSEKAELTNARKIIAPTLPSSSRRQMARVSTAPASTSVDMFSPFPERTSSLGNLGLPREEIQLFLSRNHIRTLPRQLFQVEKLTVLIIRANSLTSIPPEISKLANLRELNVANNKIRYLPSEILHLSLAQLHVHPNPFLPIPPSLAPPISKRPFSRSRSLWGTRALMESREIEAERVHTKIVSEVSRKLPKVIPLQELCLRHLFSPCRQSPSNNPSTSILQARYHLPLLEPDIWSTPSPKVRLRSPFPDHLESLFEAILPGCTYGEECVHQDSNPSVVSTPEEDDARITGVGTCPSPHHLAPGSGSTPALFIHHAEERFTWEDTVAGILVGGSVPIRWRGCQWGCLDFLDSRPEMTSNATSSSVIDEAATGVTTSAGGDIVGDTQTLSTTEDEDRDVAVVAVDLNGGLDMSDFED